MIKKALSLFLITGALLALFGFWGAVNPAHQAKANGVPFATGDVFVGVGKGKIKHFSPTGVLLDTLDTGTTCNEDLGMAFDATGNLYATSAFSTPPLYLECPTGHVTKFDKNGNLVGPFGSGYGGATESVSIDAAQNVYVGQPNPPKTVLKFAPDGTPLASYAVPIQDRGSDWIDIASDQCTLYYTSEGTRILRYNVCTNTPLPDFGSVPGAALFALRILPDGSVLVAGSTNVFRLDPTGTTVTPYPAPVGTPDLFALNLDPDGLHFWTAAYYSGKIYKYAINTPAPPVFSFNSAPTTYASGLAIFGEVTAASPVPPTPAKKPQGLPADLIGQLRVSPDREFNLNGGTDNVLTYKLTVKNVGQGAAGSISAQLPIDPNLEVGYATIDPAETGVWIQAIVTDVANPYILIGFPRMEPNTQHSLMISFRAKAGAAASTSVFTRFRLGWDDDTGTGKHNLSNGVRFTLTGSTNRNDSGGEIQLFGFAAGPNNTFLAGSDFYIPGELVDFWYTDENSQSVALGQLRVDGDGNLVASVSLAPFQVGKTYTIAGHGNRSEVTGAGLIRVVASTSGVDGDKTFVVEALKSYSVKESLQTWNQLYQAR